MRPPIQSPLGQWVALMPLLFIIGLCLILVMNESAKPIDSTRNITGWVTHVNSGQLYVRIQETKPEKIRYNAKFGPINTPPAASIHNIQIKPEFMWMKVGDHVSVRVTCTERDTLVNLGCPCVAEQVTKVN